MEEGILSAVGQTKARKYELKLLQSFMVTVEVTDELEEHVVLRNAEKTLLGVPENVRNICRHGFTEMLNNVISHSGSKEAVIIRSKNGGGHKYLNQGHGNRHLSQDPTRLLICQIRAKRSLNSPRESSLPIPQSTLAKAYSSRPECLTSS